MKKYSLFVFLFLGSIANICIAQNIPNGVTAPSARTPVSVPTAPAHSVFYKRVFSPNAPIQDSSLIDLNSAVEDVSVASQYIDGLGRQIETVVKQASPSKKDLVSPVAFDVFGNMSTIYQPYAAASSSDGLFKSAPFRDDSTFYKSQFPNEQVYYGGQQYDASPLNRTIKQLAPGNSWMGSNRGISDSERANTAADSVRIWTIAISGEDDIPTSTAAYQPGSLLVKVLTDESGNVTMSYTDEIGRLVLSKKQSITTPLSGHTGWLCTYYVYDEMNHLRTVIPPKATLLLLSNNWDLAGNTYIKDNLCYTYWYDNRGRITEKHIPGTGKMYIAYDLFDRPVLTQDENLRITSQWAFIKYDGQSRPDTTGLITYSSLTPAQVIANASTQKDYPKLTGTYTVLAVNYYDDYSWITGSIPTGTLDATNINSTNFITTYNTSPSYAQQLTQSQRIRGMATGSQKLVIGSTTYLYTVNIYDDKSRLIQSKQTNFTGGTDVATSQFDFSGKVLRSHLQHQKLGHNTITHSLLTKYSYDHAGRLTVLKKNIDGTGDKTIAQYSYNELGQMITKQLGQLETQNLTYNIRGWLNGINKSYVETANSTGSFFGEAVFYDFGFNSIYTNGRIAGVKWKGSSDNVQRAYGFSYDKANRLLIADFTQQNPGSTNWTNDKMDFSVSGLKYDVNGNITNMNEKGVNVNTPLTIDSLAYSYFPGSNQLEKVKDNAATAPDLGDFQDTSLTADDYAYDANGNIIKDLNKHIHTGGGSGISMNFLNKPDNINVNGKGSIAYTYDATGALLQKVITDNILSTKTVIIYVAGFVYQKVLPSSGNAANVSDTLQYSLHEEGRIRWSYGSPVIDYFLKDHLGNVRTVVTDEQDTNAYPAASLETANIANEKLYYSGLDSGVIDRSTVSGYPTNDTYTSPNNKIQQLRGDKVNIGAGILLKVMAGDTINVHTSSWYNLGGQTPNSPQSALADLVSALTSSLPGAAGGKFGGTQVTGSMLNPSATSFLNTRNATLNSSRPNSWLNIVVLDEQLNPVLTNDGNNSYYAQVGTSNGSSVTQYNVSRPMTKSGYVYIYVSNETPNIYTYWDNLQVTQIRGPLLQEEGYYPFGLEMKAIGSMAAMKMQTNYKYNAGTMLESSFNVDYYETPAREYDVQLGRFTGVDAMAEQNNFQSTYQFGNNNPMLFNDPTGLNGSYTQAGRNAAAWVMGWSDGGSGMFGEGGNVRDQYPHGLPIDGGGGDSRGNYGNDIISEAIEIAQDPNCKYGGNISSDGTFTPFSSDIDAFNFGVNYMTQYNSWGKYGWAASVADAGNEFVKGGGLTNDNTQPNNLRLVNNRIPDVTARFDKVIEYTKSYFGCLSKMLGNRLLGDWDIFADWVFGELVKPNGKFDLKNSKDPFLGFSPYVLDQNSTATWHGVTLGVADFGNYDYGVAANAFGLSLNFALKAAGAAQMMFDPGHSSWGNFYGLFDEHQDTKMIYLGYIGSHP